MASSFPLRWYSRLSRNLCSPISHAVVGNQLYNTFVMSTLSTTSTKLCYYGRHVTTVLYQLLLVLRRPTLTYRIRDKITRRYAIVDCTAPRVWNAKRASFLFGVGAFKPKFDGNVVISCHIYIYSLPFDR